MAHAAGDSTRAAVLSHAESPECTGNLKAGGTITPLALERFDLAAARCELEGAHRVLQRHPTRSTLQRLLDAVRRHRELARGAP
jgi:hypothetical protein